MKRVSKEHEATAKALHEAIKRDNGINTADGVRRLTDAMFANLRDEKQSKRDMLSNAAYLSGMASAALIDYAQLLEDNQ